MLFAGKSDKFYVYMIKFWTPTDETQRDGHNRVWARGGGSQSDMINHVQQGGGQNQFDMKDHGSCIQSAPNSLLKQIQLQLAS